MARDIANLVATERHPYDDLLDLTAEIVCQAMGDLCAIALLSDDRRELHPLGLHHRDEVLMRELEAAGRLTWSSSGGVSEEVLRSGEPAVFAAVDLERAARDKEWVKPFLNRASVHSAVVVAMRTSGEHIGVLAVATEHGRRPIGADDVPYVQGVADRLALAVENLRLKEEVARLRNPDGPRLPDARLQALTAREIDVLALIGEGLTSREIGERLFLSVRTIEWHRGRLAAKLDVHQRSDLVALAKTLSSW
jgi:DNA-binding CsgD family transcriptional regulator